MRINGEEVGHEVLSNEFRRLMESQADRPQELRMPEEKVREIAKANVIEGTLISQEAGRRIGEVSESAIKLHIKRLKKQYGEQVPVEQFRSRIENEVRIQELYRQLSKELPKVTVDVARAEYEKHPETYSVPEQVHCSHIVRHTFGGADPNKSLQEIMEAQQLIRNGQPFEQVARRFSDQHGQAGDLGTFPRGQMVDKFDNVVFRMQPGEVSDVFQTEFGYHIVQLHEKLPERQRTFEEARDDVTRRLKEEQLRNAIDQLVDNLKSNATIEEEPDDEAGGNS